MFSVVVAIYGLLTILTTLFVSKFGPDIWTELNFLTPASDHALWLFARLIFAFAAGALIGDLIGARLKLNVYAREARKSNLDNSSPTAAMALSVFAIAVVGVMVLVFGDDLFSRANYQFDEEAGGLLGLFGTVAEQMIGLVPAALRHVIPLSARYRAIAFVTLIVCVLYLYAASTKFSAAAWFLYFAIANIRDGKISIRVLIGYSFSLIVLALTLHQRHIESYGLVSLFETVSALLDDPFEVTSFGLKVFSSAIYITSETYSAAASTWHLILVELNPLPGVYTTWYENYELQRVNVFIPFNALGTLGSYSFALLAAYGTACAISISMLRGCAAAVSPSYSALISLIYGVVFCGFITQYNVRASARLVYYLLILYMACRIWLMIKAKQPADVEAKHG